MFLQIECNVENWSLWLQLHLKKNDKRKKKDKIVLFGNNTSIFFPIYFNTFHQHCGCFQQWLDEPYGGTQQGAILQMFHCTLMNTCLNDIPVSRCGLEKLKRTSEICSKSSNFLTLLSHLTLSPLGIGFRHSHTFSGVPLTIPSPL